MGKKKLVRVCKKCSGFDVKELGSFLDDKQYSTGCIDKCLKKKSKLNGKIYGYGTPWCGKEGISQNRRVEITDILMIRRGEDNSATSLAPASALRLL